ncbi:MAG: hypothetical protein LBL05_09280 [Synergistaceae bacterium]|nr:hypothetical protein [Synergistaceae bacterium]
METFSYGDNEINYLKSRDKTLGKAIDRIGTVRREVNPDLFSALVNSIVGQQISTKAHITIWNRMRAEFGAISPETLAVSTEERLQSCGITFKKAGYIRSIAEKVVDGGLDIAALSGMPDADVCAALAKLADKTTWGPSVALALMSLLYKCLCFAASRRLAAQRLSHSAALYFHAVAPAHFASPGLCGFKGCVPETKNCAAKPVKWK